jgi:hypothetical protein
MPLSMAHIDPLILSSPIRLGGGPATIERFRQRLNHVADILAVGELTGSGHGKDVRPPEFLDQLQGGIGRVTGIAEPHNCSHPRRRFKVPEHLTESDVLMSLALRINGGKLHRHAKPVPACHPHHHAKAKAMGR